MTVKLRDTRFTYIIYGENSREILFLHFAHDSHEFT